MHPYNYSMFSYTTLKKSQIKSLRLTTVALNV